MFIRDLQKCKQFTSGDNCILRELFNPLKDTLDLKYSLAHAVVEPGKTTYSHRLKSSEVYYILKGRGEMHIDGETKKVRKGQAVYIPPYSVQRIKNTGRGDLVFLCIVDPAWKKEDEEIAEGEK
jgi:mannose-6-phosphate isomerase-like protein (cupin superfamily)